MHIAIHLRLQPVSQHRLQNRRFRLFLYAQSLPRITGPRSDQGADRSGAGLCYILKTCPGINADLFRLILARLIQAHFHFQRSTRHFQMGQSHT